MILFVIILKKKEISVIALFAFKTILPLFLLRLLEKLFLANNKSTQKKIKKVEAFIQSERNFYYSYSEAALKKTRNTKL